MQKGWSTEKRFFAKRRNKSRRLRKSTEGYLVLGTTQQQQLLALQKMWQRPAKQQTNGQGRGREGRRQPKRWRGRGGSSNLTPDLFQQFFCGCSRWPVDRHAHLGPAPFFLSFFQLLRCRRRSGAGPDCEALPQSSKTPNCWTEKLLLFTLLPSFSLLAKPKLLLLFDSVLPFCILKIEMSYFSSQLKLKTVDNFCSGSVCTGWTLQPSLFQLGDGGSQGLGVGASL